MFSNSIDAVIFDMDGVLIDTEPVWETAELEVFSALGLPISPADMHDTVGLRIDQVVDYWYKRFPWDPYDNAVVAGKIVERVVAHIRSAGHAMPGVVDALGFCRSSGLKVGLATSSSWSIIDAVLDTLGIRDAFDAIESAQDLALGKPHPEVYLRCADSLGLSARHCLAVEDSFNGLIAARAATMQTLAIPPAHQRQEPRWAVAHQVADSLDALPALLTAHQSQKAGR